MKELNNFQKSPENDQIASSQGWFKKELPSYEEENNKPARLINLCLKYRGMVSSQGLQKALTERLRGAEPFMVSTQPDGSYTLFYKLFRPLALPQEKQQAERLLEAWKNAYGLSRIAGAELDQKHFIGQLVCPTEVGAIEVQNESTYRITDARMFVERLAKELTEGAVLFDSALLLTHMEAQGWKWNSSEPFQPGCLGTLDTPRFGSFRAIVTEKGFYSLGCYLAFYAYDAIVGEKAWGEVKGSCKEQALLDSFFYQEMDKDRFALVKRNEVRKCTSTEFSACLENLYNVGRGSMPSLIRSVIVEKKVDGVRNFMYYPHRIIRTEGKTYINTSDVKLLQPDEDAPSDRYKKNCPAINHLLNSLFGANSAELEVFLTWLALAYQGAYYGRPRRGHALYIVGAPGTGKTLLRELLGLLFGRSRSGQEFFCEASQFNSYALDDNPLVYLDDASVDWRRCNQMHNRIKELVATGEASLNGKYEAQRHVEWFGRILVTCNPVGEGRKLIPEIRDDNRDKFIILMTSTQQLDNPMLGRQARSELPAFAHFLKHYYSRRMNPSLRFGMEAFVSDSVREATLFRDGEGLLVECLEKILSASVSLTETLDYTVTELFQKLSDEPAVSGQLSGICTAKNLGGKLSKIREAVENRVVNFPYDISLRRTSTRRSWIFTPRKEISPTK